MRNPFGKKNEKPKYKGTSSQKREVALAEIAQRLGAAYEWYEISQNAYIHHSLPGHSSYAMAFEERMHILLTPVTVTITDWACKCDIQPCDEDKCKKIADKIVRKTQILRDKDGELRTLFHDTMTMTDWIMKYFQQSPSVNAKAREDQVELAKAGYAVPAVMGWQPLGQGHKPPDE